MASVGAVCCVYEDHVWLRAMVDGCYAAVERLTFLVGQRPWYGKVGDNTATLAAIHACPDPDRKIFVVTGDWPTEAAQRNAGLDLCAQKGLSLCFIVDADELHDPAVLRMMFSVAASQPEIFIWRMRCYTYWKTYRYRIDPLEAFVPAVLVRVGSTRFVKNRLLPRLPTCFLAPELGIYHHMSYARGDHDIITKLAHFSLAEQVRPNWFQQVWKAWDFDHDMENLHPVHPGSYRRAIFQDPLLYPPVLKKICELATTTSQNTTSIPFCDTATRDSSETTLER